MRERLEEFTERSPVPDAAIAVEATTGWRYVVEELRRAGLEPHLADPAETESLQGRKKRAKTDRLDAGHLRDLLVIDRLPESWIPPEHIQEIQALMRLRHSLIEERTPISNASTPSSSTTAILSRAIWTLLKAAPVWRRWSFRGLPKVVDLSLAMIDHINEELEPIEAQLRAYARSQAGCQALMEHYGVGELTSVALLSELGDTRRFSSSKKAVRYAGLDVTVRSSDDKRAAGKLSRRVRRY